MTPPSSAPCAASATAWARGGDDLSRDLICALDGDGRILSASSTVERSLGWTEDDLVGRFILNFVHPEDVQGVHSSYRAATPEAPHVDVVHRVRSRERRWHWFDVAATMTFAADGRPAGIQLAARDVTERREADDALRRTAARLDTLAGAATGGILMADAEQRITVVSEAFCRLFDIAVPRDALIGADVRDALTPLVRLLSGDTDWAVRDAELMLAGRAVSDERLQLTDGRTLERDYVPIGDGDGHLWIFRDITEHKRLEEELREAVQARTDFLATMSHEIRTPLSGIAGAAELLLAAEVDGERRELAAIVRDAAGTLSRLLDDVLEDARMEAGHVGLEEADYDPRRLIATVAGVLRPSLRGRRVALVAEVDDSVPCALRGDAGRVHQILLNLGGNAVKYTDRGEIHLRLSTRDERLVATVADTGPGISPERVEHLFDAWTRNHGRDWHGTGLGLGIARKLARAMGGDVAAASRLGEGSTFTLELPLVAGRKPTDPAAAARTPLTGHVLVAEDGRALRRLLGKQLERIGLESTLVDDGAPAVEAALTRRFDAILLDLRMPTLGGLEAAERIRAAERERGLPAVPIIALTADATPVDAAHSRAAGMDAHLAKPVALADLHAALARVIPTAPALDGDVLADLAAGLGDEAVLDELLAAYRATLDDALARLRDAVDGGTAETIRAAAHAVRSEAAAFGAVRLAESARRVEQGDTAALATVGQAAAATAAALDGRLRERA